jgi:hypothetical protein
MLGVTALPLPVRAADGLPVEQLEPVAVRGVAFEPASYISSPATIIDSFVPTRSTCVDTDPTDSASACLTLTE